MREEKTHGVTCKSSNLAASQLPLKRCFERPSYHVAPFQEQDINTKTPPSLNAFTCSSPYNLFISLFLTHTHTHFNLCIYTFMCMCLWINLLINLMNLCHLYQYYHNIRSPSPSYTIFDHFLVCYMHVMNLVSLSTTFAISLDTDGNLRK